MLVLKRVDMVLSSSAKIALWGLWVTFGHFWKKLIEYKLFFFFKLAENHETLWFVLTHFLLQCFKQVSAEITWMQIYQQILCIKSNNQRTAYTEKRKASDSFSICPGNVTIFAFSFFPSFLFLDEIPKVWDTLIQWYFNS